MMKRIVTIAAAISATLVLASTCSAQQRQNRPQLRENPYAFQFLLEADLCRKVAWSVPPEVPPGDPRLGKCPHRYAFSPQPKFR